MFLLSSVLVAIFYPPRASCAGLLREVCIFRIFRELIFYVYSRDCISVYLHFLHGDSPVGIFWCFMILLGWEVGWGAFLVSWRCGNVRSGSLSVRAVAKISNL